MKIDTIGDMSADYSQYVDFMVQLLMQDKYLGNVNWKTMTLFKRIHILSWNGKLSIYVTVTVSRKQSRKLSVDGTYICFRRRRLSITSEMFDNFRIRVSAVWWPTVLKLQLYLVSVQPNRFEIESSCVEHKV